MEDSLARSHAANLLGWDAAQAERLGGGLTNYVWRLTFDGKTAILKHAKPFMAADSSISLDPKRLAFEARALRSIPELVVGTRGIAVPDVLAFDAENSVLVMEDLDGREFRTCLTEAAAPPCGARLGTWLGELHQASRSHAEQLSKTMNNQEIQRTRQKVQYAPMGELFKDRTDQWSIVESRSSDLATRFLGAGECLIMGDLWPPSITVLADSRLGLFDFEFSHWGRPEQDVAHLLAHLWMLAHLSETHAATFASAFVDAYFSRANWRVDNFEAAAVHFGCEVAARTLGAFSSNSSYASESTQQIEEAAHIASLAILGEFDIFKDWLT